MPTPEDVARRDFLIAVSSALVAARLPAIVHGRVPAADVTLQVELPSDRSRVGRMSVIDAAGRLVAGPFHVLGKADGQTAAQHNNATRSTLLKYGDTPTGTYRVNGGFRTGNGTGYGAHSYGDQGALRLEPISGDAKQAFDLGGRTGLLIHGGDLGDGERLRPTNGCLRLSNGDMKALLDELVFIAVTQGEIHATCAVQTVAVQVSDPLAAPDEGYDEGDPPPTTQAPKIP